MTTIDYSEASILSNETSAFMYKKFGQLEQYLSTPLIVDFHGNQIKPGSIVSNQFQSNGKLYSFTDYIAGVDNTAGNVFQVEKTASTSSINYSVVGSINYDTGYITIKSLTYDTTPANGLKIFAAPVNQDIYSSRNNILEIDTGAGVSTTIVSD